MLTEIEYIQLFRDCVVDKDKYPVIDKVIDQLLQGRKVYTYIAKSIKYGENYVRLSHSLVSADAGLQQVLYPAGASFFTRYYADNTDSPFMPALGMGMGNVPFPSTGPANVALPQANNLFSVNPAVDAAMQQLVRVPRSLKNGSTGAEIPWYVIGLIHYIECGFSFKKHLYNGDPLTGKTVHYPPGRPLSSEVGDAPYSFVESAMDSLSFLHFNTQSNWRLPLLLHKLEQYNGMGYQRHTPPIHSPYLWSYSNQYQKGKFVEKKIKGHMKAIFEPDLVSKQVGLAVVLKRMTDRCIITIPMQ
ncbi:hypothetical protein [Deminuibacter soli]|uniref:Uncharacterized protein n=1 Tax=Deminuibacter soli TaxID=2291815 RepID=A0A3E1NCC7_9BACT|nr:hypothetical protein [Deminuibacter soli]RFM25590.1 hypothetical protein DXN05_24235 [Deminuibacter soli]